jgi:pimeloyl-ACP methyl ester carboxylesterase
MTVLGVAPPPAGGIDFDLPGDDIRLGATRWPGTGTPVVLLHGLASQRRFWNLVVPHLVGSAAGDGLPVLAIDQRGHGDSDRPPASYELIEIANDLAIALDAVGWSRAVVVGHSWGGAVAATFAAEHPERTLAVLGIDGGTSPPVPPGADRAQLRKRLEPPRFAMAPDELVTMIRSRTVGGGANADEVAAAVLPIFAVGDDGLARARLPFEVHMKILDTLLEYDASATLAKGAMPDVVRRVWLAGRRRGPAPARRGLRRACRQPSGCAVHAVGRRDPRRTLAVARAGGRADPDGRR